MNETQPHSGLVSENEGLRKWGEREKDKWERGKERGGNIERKSDWENERAEDIQIYREGYI